jgi:hypothetical protein
MSVTMPTVARINVTPVKSTALQHPDEILLESYGVAGNRDFFFVDEDGRRFSGDKKTPLLPVRSDYDAERDRLRLVLPGGEETEGSAAADGEPLTVDFYGRPVPAHIVDGRFAAVMSEHAGRTVRLARADEAGGGNDVRPVTIVSLSSIRELSKQGRREEMVDPRRFRMLFELEGCEPHEEDSWEGMRVRIGEAAVAVGSQVPRCVITTLDPDTGVRDFPTLSVIKTYRGVTEDQELPFGVYGDVLQVGIVRVGDPVEVVDQWRPSSR